MSVKFLYESVSFVIALAILKRFAFPFLKDFIDGYKQEIVDNINELETNIRHKSNIAKEMRYDVLEARRKYEKFTHDLHDLLESHKINLLDKYEQMLNKHDDQLYAETKKNDKKYQSEVYKVVTEMIKDEVYKNIKQKSDTMPSNMIKQLKDIDLSRLIRND